MCLLLVMLPSATAYAYWVNGVWVIDNNANNTVIYPASASSTTVSYPNTVNENAFAGGFLGGLAAGALIGTWGTWNWDSGWGRWQWHNWNSWNRWNNNWNGYPWRGNGSWWDRHPHDGRVFAAPQNRQQFQRGYPVNRFQQQYNQRQIRNNQIMQYNQQRYRNQYNFRSQQFGPGGFQRGWHQGPQRVYQPAQGRGFSNGAYKQHHPGFRTPSYRGNAPHGVFQGRGFGGGFHGARH